MNDFIDPDELNRLERATAPANAPAPNGAPGFVDDDPDAAALREGWLLAASILGQPLPAIDERRLVRQVLKRSSRRKMQRRALVAAMLLVCGTLAWGWRRDPANTDLPQVAKGPAKNLTTEVAGNDSVMPKGGVKAQDTPHPVMATSAGWDDDNVDDELAEARQAFVQLQEEVRPSSGSFEGLGRDLNALEEDLLETKL